MLKVQIRVGKNTQRSVSNKGQVWRTAFSLIHSAWSLWRFWAKSTAFSSYSFILEPPKAVQTQCMCQWVKVWIHNNYSHYLLTIISSPTPVARQSEPATLVAIFSRGSVTIGRPAHRTSVPVVWALHNGLLRTKPSIPESTKLLLDMVRKKSKEIK